MSTNGDTPARWPCDMELVKSWEWTDVLTVLGGVGLDVMQGPRAVEAMCAVAWVLARRADPDAQWAFFRDLTLGDLAVSTASPPEAFAGVSGVTPPPSVDAGT